MACTPNPPDLLLHLIKKMGTELCQIDEKFLSEKVLNQRKKKVGKAIDKIDSVISEVAPDVRDKDVAAQKKQEEAGKKKKKIQLKANRKPSVADLAEDVQEEDGANQGGVAPKKMTKKSSTQ